MPAGLEPAAADATAAWQRVGEGVLAGVCHTLNSRVTALWGLAELLTEGADESLLALFRAELERLERLARLLHWLPRRPGRGAERVSLADLLPELVELHREHRGFEGTEVALEGDPLTPPVVVDPAALGRAVLLLLSAAARLAPRGARITVGYGPAAGAAALTIRAPGAELPAGADALPELDAARHLLNGASEISVSHETGSAGAVQFELRFSTA
ncbi:MAG: hypothetical protein DIU52_007350 [bacterium]|jgi:signal transduction histidine kinase|nr:MAG: hypothetical protein DIU52_11345 [bacterium]